MQDTENQDWVRRGNVIELSEGIPVAPSLVVVDDELWLYYSLRENTFDTVFLIKSIDGVNWDEPVEITGFQEETEIKHFNVKVNSDGFKAIMGGGSITELVSVDGIDWEITGTQLIPSSDFDEWGQLYPTQDDTSERIWFSGFSGITYAIGLAEKGTAGWINKGVVLASEVSSEYDNTAVAQSSVLQIDDGLMMWYGGYDTSDSDPGPWRILSAQSADGLVWNKNGLALDLTEEGDEAWSVRDPTVILFQGLLWMTYTSLGDDSVYRLKIASCE
jgi:hypothetical protein